MHEALASWSPRAGAPWWEEPGDRGHRLVWRMFGDASEIKRDFLYQPVTLSPFRIVLRSVRPPAPCSGWTVERCRPFAPVLAPGDRLAFRVTCVPTRWRSRDSRRGAREHLPQAVRRLHPGVEADPEAYGRALDAAAREWINAQGTKRGFRVDLGSLSVGDWQPWNFWRGGARSLAFDSLTFEGLLTVEDPGGGEGGFLTCLRSGLGAERAFGFGLLQVRPAPW